MGLFIDTVCCIYGLLYYEETGGIVPEEKQWTDMTSEDVCVKDEIF